MKKYLVVGKNVIQGKIVKVDHCETNDIQEAIDKEILFMKKYDKVASYENIKEDL